MTRRDALIELRDKVKAGVFPGGIDGPARKIFPYNARDADDLGLTAALAFEGSLDAAKALHGAVLPGWEYQIVSRSFVEVFDGNPFGGFSKSSRGCGDEPARAWLLAILEALIAQEA